MPESPETTDPQPPDEHRIILDAGNAREQASEKMSFLASTFVRGKSGTLYEIPHKNLLDDEQQERYDELLDKVNHVYEREPDIRTSDGKVIARGAVILPHRENGARVPQTWARRLANVLFGEQGAKKALADGFTPNLIEVVWAKQDYDFSEWRDRDPKSGSDGPDLGAASGTD